MTKCKNGYRRFYQFYSCCSHYYLLKKLLQPKPIQSMTKSSKRRTSCRLIRRLCPYEFHAKVDGEDKIVGFDISIAQKLPTI